MLVWISVGPTSGPAGIRVISTTKQPSTLTHNEFVNFSDESILNAVIQTCASRISLNHFSRITCGEFRTNSSRPSVSVLCPDGLHVANKCAWFSRTSRSALHMFAERLLLAESASSKTSKACDATDDSVADDSIPDIPFLGDSPPIFFLRVSLLRSTLFPDMGSGRG